ncbi:phosphate propanoyltransferase [Clostridium tetani]|uniref:Phosphate propanoyltransferase n=1 Tax=Clostridium tetani TaxID=1513 RepID=A0ABC8EDW3_CLOTA|nr:ethanolamine utilization phosphate acetyltransferase EutD [Clostridium tetani]RXI53753.1 propanediol utilization protein [Clostridium tetani]RXI54683.1 propanediol utilization protein [Clostridium tetani]RXM70402.1 propanediol utilization protein [Clostridium tetani]BDR67905.1 phosphate propanoyltransferase [Clostridium tetani]BDR70533.1 phosphate propanoyltransferase [Clostridium tetani]
MKISNEEINYIVDEVTKRLKEEKEDLGILIEASGKHVHLSKEHVEKLFGKGYELTKKRDLSQPGQYLCEEKVTLIGPKGIMQNVSVLGPTRENTQVEVSKSDAVSLGINAPIRMSGDTKRTSPIILASKTSVVRLEEGAIVAKRHIHMTPEDALKYGVTDKEKVQVKVKGERSLIFDEVIVRVSDKFNTVVHIDYDEANACGFVKNTRGEILK